ncbi:ABC-2 type transport system ATP-binding protein [Methanomicrobium sp. W14]|uniref:ABC transporter ATP-binding protein n=1 Tax=Methanomicrobium sp. W14 TaxID=2817839 RepID=UPI001AE2935E|nr:ABC transporter ATP-binding protein [Methanomicrobium sp. W14]MBP2133948.1 ABC-2 type transport system ATP-binding protein [Methanomicrobium sp. W14]
MIETVDLTKEYNGVKAVDNLNLKVDEGEIFGFLGPNGAGKSTTILMLTGMIEPTSGVCTVDGVDVARNPLKAKELIGYLPEDVGFYGNLTAGQNLDYFGQFYGMSSEERKDRIEYLLDLVRLNGVTQTVGGYSRGMNQRLGLAQALLNDPKVVILDEPTANLDPEGVAQFRNIIRHLSEEGKTIFICSHILSEIRQLCKTVGILSQGKLVARGTVLDVENQLISLSNSTMKIIIETEGKIPEIKHPDIIDMKITENRAEITVNKDIRREISSQLKDSCPEILEMYLQKPELEELFLKVYKRE